MLGYLVLENGEIFEGERIGYSSDVACEVVFNTGMGGYIESITDPSYVGQGMVMTYPLIGNYGIIPEDCESDKVWIKAIFIHEMAEFESNFRKKFTLDKFLRDSKVPGLTNINTRKLTKILRNSGTMNGYLTSNIDNIEEIMEKIKSYKIENPVNIVTSKQISQYGKNMAKHVALFDLGFKHNIVNSLLKRGVGVTVYPANTTAEEILNTKPDGIILSNGPGNPNECKNQIEIIKRLYNSDIPILGICLGHQLMAMANGARIEKLKYGHRGENHPVKHIKKDRVYITSQNHGYYIKEESINTNIAEISYVSLNDGTIEGLRYKNKNINTVQFHPEACPGPEDTEYIFDEFVNTIKEEEKCQKAVE